MTSRRERVKELIAQKEEVEQKIDETYAKWDEDEKREKEEMELARKSGNPLAFTRMLLPGTGILRSKEIEGLRNRIARVNDELTVNLLDSIDSHSSRLEWLTFALIATTVVLIALTGYQILRVF